MVEKGKVFILHAHLVHVYSRSEYTGDGVLHIHVHIIYMYVQVD